MKFAKKISVCTKYVLNTKCVCIFDKMYELFNMYTVMFNKKAKFFHQVLKSALHNE